MMPLTVVLAPLLFFRPERVPTWIFGVALAPGALLILLSGVGFSNPILVMVLALAASETAYCMIMLDIVLGRMTEKKTTADS